MNIAKVTNLFENTIFIQFPKSPILFHLLLK